MTSKLTVLSVAYPFAPVRPDTAGGAEQVLGILDRALTRDGHRSIVLACEGSSTAGRLVETPAVRGIIDDRLRGEIHGEYRAAIERALRSERIDLVHMHGLDFEAYLPPPGVPVLATLHLPLSWYDSRALVPERPRTWLVCVSFSQQSSCPALPALLGYIGNGVEVGSYAPKERKARFAFSLGRICPEKGFHHAIEAARLAGVPFILAGTVFPYVSHIRYHEELILPFLDGRRSRFIGAVGGAGKRMLLAAARCLLAPSLVPETSSLVAMEALASGTPVIAFPSGALPEIVEDGITGFIVRNVEEMAEAIREVDAIDPRTCLRAARERFSLEKMFRSYLSVYREILDA